MGVGTGSFGLLALLLFHRLHIPAPGARLRMLTTSRLRVSSIWVNRSKDSRLCSCLGFFWA